MGEYTVYVHICPNGKRYYGSTRRKVKYRWNNGKGYDGNEEFWKDINKYGWDNIEHIIVAKGLTKDDAKWLEIELIKTSDTTNPDKGYNRAFGDAITRGKICSKDTRYKMSSAKVGETNPRAKSVFCVTTRRVFHTVKDGADYYGIKHSGIVLCCQGKLKSSGKYNGQKLVWRYITIDTL